MDFEEYRPPVVGDHVTVDGDDGEWVIANISADRRTLSLKEKYFDVGGVDNWVKHRFLAEENKTPRTATEQAKLEASKRWPFMCSEQELIDMGPVAPNWGKGLPPISLDEMHRGGIIEQAEDRLRRSVAPVGISPLDIDDTLRKVMTEKEKAYARAYGMSMPKPDMSYAKPRERVTIDIKTRSAAEFKAIQKELAERLKPFIGSMHGSNIRAHGDPLDLSAVSKHEPAHPQAEALGRLINSDWDQDSLIAAIQEAEE
jgi:hypothetical protein